MRVGTERLLFIRSVCSNFKSTARMRDPPGGAYGIRTVLNCSTWNNLREPKNLRQSQKDQHGCHGYTRIDTDLCLRIVNQPASSSEAKGGGGSNIRTFASGARSGNLRISERRGVEAPHFRAKRGVEALPFMGGSEAFRPRGNTRPILSSRFSAGQTRDARF